MPRGETPGMAASPRRKRPNGSLRALKRGLFSVFLRNVEFVEDEEQALDTRLRASTAAVQAGLAYARVIELYEVEQRMARLEGLTQGNGHLS
jgi:hypothetical protein